MPEIFKNQIIKLLKHTDYEPLKLAQLAKTLDVSPEDYPEFKDAFKSSSISLSFETVCMFTLILVAGVFLRRPLLLRLFFPPNESERETIDGKFGSGNLGSGWLYLHLFLNLQSPLNK